MARSIPTLLCFVLILGILFCELADGAKKWKKGKKGPKCSRLFKKIPVHRKFDIDRFSGTWYVIRRTTEVFGENTYESSSIKITKNNDDTYSYSLTGKSGDDTCKPVETWPLELTKRTGVVVLKTQFSPVRMIISYTGYKDLAIAYYCFSYKKGRKDQCSMNGLQVEILSRTVRPKQKLVKEYLQRTAKRLCVSPDRLKPTVPGACKIPDILEAAKKKEIDGQIESDDRDKKPECAVANIFVQEDFEISQMDGVWYEIARTRFTFNKQESIVTRLTYDESDDVIKSLYTGVKYFPENNTFSECGTAIRGMSRTREGANYNADMEGRIGGKKSGYWWVPMKILYADDDYMMFYACYAVGEDGHCNPQYMEVTLVGRTPFISKETRDVIYSLLPGICVNAIDMVDTKFLRNCSEWVTQDPEEVEPSDCKLHDIHADPDYETDMLKGTWYLYASINYTNKTLTSVVMKKTVTGPEEQIYSHINAIDLDNSPQCTEYNMTSREMCLYSGNHIVNHPFGATGQFHFSKILNVTEHFLVEYTCLKPNLDDTCDRSGIQFNVYTRHKGLLYVDDDQEGDADNDDNDGDDEDLNGVDDVDDFDDNFEDEVDDDNNDDELNDGVADPDVIREQAMAVIKQLTKSVCLDPNDLQFETEWCDDLSINYDLNSSTSTCDIDQFDLIGELDDFRSDGLYGYWYEVVRKIGGSFLGDSGPLVAYIGSDTNKSLEIYFSSTETDGEITDCTDVESITILDRCDKNSNGDFLLRFRETETYVSYVPFKIIYTDYDKVMLTYVCEEVLPDGHCANNSAFIRIWARNSSLTQEVYDDVISYLEWACIDESSSFANFSHKEDSECMEHLQQYIIENTEEVHYANVTESPDVNENQDEQRDQSKDSVDLDDIEHELMKSDEEFYDL